MAGDTPHPIRVVGWPAFKGTGTRSGNPYTRLLYESVVRSDPTVVVEEFSFWRFLLRRCDVWHVHWPQYVVETPRAVRAVAKLFAFVLLVAVAKMRRTRIVWTVHDLAPHDSRRPRLTRRCTGWFSRRVHGIIGLTDYGLSEAIRYFPYLRATPARAIPHGHFRGVYPSTLMRAEARTRLDIEEDAFAFVFIGRVRPYKNVPALARAFQ